MTKTKIRHLWLTGVQSTKGLYCNPHLLMTCGLQNTSLKVPVGKNLTALLILTLESADTADTQAPIANHSQGGEFCRIPFCEYSLLYNP